MTTFLIVGFKYCEKLYQSLIHCKTKYTGKEYRITVMNGDLEKLLYGNHIIKEANGSLYLEASENKERDLLKMRIALSLGKLLRIPVRKKLSAYPINSRDLPTQTS